MWQWISFSGELFYVKISHCEGNIVIVVPDIQETDQKTLKHASFYTTDIYQIITTCTLKLHSYMSVKFCRSVMSDFLWPRGLQHTRLPCPSSTPRAYSNSCPSSWWFHPTISPSVGPISSCLQSFPASGSFPKSWFFASCSQSIGASASSTVLPMNIQDWFPLGLSGLISLQSKGLSRVFSNTTVQKHQFFSTQLLSNSHIHTWLLEKS